MQRGIAVGLMIACVTFLSCGDRACGPSEGDPVLTGLWFSAVIWDDIGLDARRISLDAYSGQQALVQVCWYHYRQEPEITRRLVTELEEGDVSIINDLLHRWDDFESRYWPGFDGKGPARTSWLGVRYAPSGTDTISIATLGQETIPPTPEPLSSAARDLMSIMKRLLGWPE